LSIPTTLSRLLDHIELAALQKASELSPEQTEALADDIDATVWGQVKDMYTT